MRHCFYLFIILATIVACNPYPRESQQITNAFEQAQLVYGDGENDTLLFIPELDRASSYYANKKDYTKAALAALYYGYSEQSYNKVAAMESFKVAEQYGELVKDSLTMARAEYKMGKMLYQDYLAQEALLLLRKSNKNFNKHYAERALAQNVAACCYMLCKEYDSARIFLNESLLLAELGNSKEAKRKAMNNYAVLYGLLGEEEEALACLRLVETENDQQKILKYLNLGKNFMVLGIMDSAAYYYGCVENFLFETDIKDETKASAYAYLSQFAELQGDQAKALDYKKKDMQYVVKVKDRIEGESIYRIQQQYDHEKLRNEMNKKIIVHQHIILFMSMVVVVFLVVVALSQVRLARIRKREIDAKERILFYVRQYSELLSKQGKTIQKLAIVMDHKDDRALLDILRATVFEKKDPWEALMDVFDTLYPDESERIVRCYPELSDLERKDIVLSYFDVSRQDEALLLHISIHSVDKIRQSVKMKTTDKTKKTGN